MIESPIPQPLTSNAACKNRLGIACGPRFFLLLLVGLAWLVPALINLHFLYGMFAWDILILAAWAIDLARLPQPALLSVTRTWNTPAALAVPASIGLSFQNNSKTALRAGVIDSIPSHLRLEVPQLCFQAPPYGTASGSYEIMPTRRGETMVGPIYLRYQTPFRIAERWAAAELSQKICVYPNLEEARQHAIYMIRSRQIELEKRYSRSRGQGREFESLREYRDGDEFRSICWSAAARRGKLITRLYQAERSQTIWIVIDSGRLMRARVSGLSKLDYAVNAALSLGQVALGSGDQIGLLAYGRHVNRCLLPHRGRLHLRKLMEELALVQEETGEADHLKAAGALLSKQNRRSLVFWLTDLAETAAIPEVVDAAGQTLSRNVLVFVVIGQPDLAAMGAEKPDSVSRMYLAAAAQEMMHRRELLLARLRQRGALAVEVDSAGASASVINAYLEVKQRSLL